MRLITKFFPWLLIFFLEKSFLYRPIKIVCTRLNTTQTSLATCKPNGRKPTFVLSTTKNKQNHLTHLCIPHANMHPFWKIKISLCRFHPIDYNPFFAVSYNHIHACTNMLPWDKWLDTFILKLALILFFYGVKFILISPHFKICNTYSSTKKNIEQIWVLFNKKIMLKKECHNTHLHCHMKYLRTQKE